MYIEDGFTELKSKLTKDIKKEIIAFANTHGGKIYIGIDDDGNVVGLDNIKEDIEALSCMIRERINPDLVLYTNIEEQKINDKKIIVVDIMEGSNKPYYLIDKGLKPTGVYLRYGNTSAPANENIIKKMIIDSESLSFENMKSQNQDLHFEYLEMIFKEKDIVFNKEKLKVLNLVNLDGEYTNLGLLLSDECPFSVKCAIFSGNNKLEFQDRKEFSGSVLKQVNDCFNYFDLFNRIKGKIVGLERIDTKDYPDYALRESLLNAIIHRDYSFSGSILVSLFNNRFEITSLGGLVKGVSMEDIYSGISASRNSNLANIFYRLKYVESFGTGIERIMESYVDYDKKPVFLTTPNTFKVVLYNVNYVDIEEENPIINNLSQEEQIIEYLRLNNKINRVQVERLLGLSKSRTTDILNIMLKNNIIKQEGSGRATYYILNNN